MPDVYGGGAVPWTDVMPHLMRRVEWTEPSFAASVVIADDLVLAGAEGGDAARAAFWRSAQDADMVLLVGVHNPAQADFLLKHTGGIACAVTFACCDAVTQSARLHFQPASALFGALAATLPWARTNKDAELLDNARRLFDRRTPSDFVFATLLLLDGAVAPVRTLTMNKRTTLANIACMARNCGNEVVSCVSDPQCKAALDCLEACSLNDQVCSYRCIVSYESPKFEQFTLCVLQKHNCLGNSAERPQQPAIAPMTHFRDEPLTHEVAEDLLIGWLATPGAMVSPAQQLRYSWMVVSGVNEV